VVLAVDSGKSAGRGSYGIGVVGFSGRTFAETEADGDPETSCEVEGEGHGRSVCGLGDLAYFRVFPDPRDIELREEDEIGACAGCAGCIAGHISQVRFDLAPSAKNLCKSDTHFRPFEYSIL
jgi:hypothetical protein